MRLIRALARIPFVIWFILFGGYLYLNYSTWKTETYDPMVQDIDAQRTTVLGLQKQNQAAENFAQEREAKFQDLQSKASEYQAAIEKLPRSADIPGILTSLADVSDKVGIEIVTFQPNKSEMKELLIETSFKIELRGSFIQLMSFLDEVAHLKRIIATTSVSLKEPVLKGRDAILRAEATLITYHFDENARGSAINTDSPKAPPFPTSQPTSQPVETPVIAPPPSAAPQDTQLIIPPPQTPGQGAPPPTEQTTPPAEGEGSG